MKGRTIALEPRDDGIGSGPSALGAVRAVGGMIGVEVLSRSYSAGRGVGLRTRSVILFNLQVQFELYISIGGKGLVVLPFKSIPTIVPPHHRLRCV